MRGTRRAVAGVEIRIAGFQQADGRGFWTCLFSGLAPVAATAHPRVAAAHHRPAAAHRRPAGAIWRRRDVVRIVVGDGALTVDFYLTGLTNLGDGGFVKAIEQLGNGTSTMYESAGFTGCRSRVRDGAPCGVMSPAIRRSRVVLPAPFGTVEDLRDVSIKLAWR
jgi:hypothetical protein